MWLVLIGILTVQFGAAISRGLFGEVPPIDGVAATRYEFADLLRLAPRLDVIAADTKTLTFSTTRMVDLQELVLRRRRRIAETSSVARRRASASSKSELATEDSANA